jgi:hypothetical protein
VTSFNYMTPRPSGKVAGALLGDWTIAGPPALLERRADSRPRGAEQSVFRSSSRTRA